MITEGLPVARDPQLRRQAETLLADGFAVTLICPRDRGNKVSVPGVRVLEYPAPPVRSGPLAFLFEYVYSLAMTGLLGSWELASQGFDVIQVGSPPNVYFVLTAPETLAATWQAP